MDFRGSIKSFKNNRLSDKIKEKESQQIPYHPISGGPLGGPLEAGETMRYPKSGIGRKWTVIELKAIGPSWKGEVLSDGDGLSGQVLAAADGSC